MNFVSFFGVLVAFLLVVSVNGERVKRAIVADRWPTKNIPYRFDQNFVSETAREKIRSILEEMKKLLAVDGQKCIDFNEIDQHQEESYILFENKDEGCSGHLGYIENRIRELNLADECLGTYTIMHEVLHLLGFDHEQSRYDRDQFVYINHDNILSSADNFEVSVRSNSNKSQGVPYDFFSVSHYSSTMFANDIAKFTVKSKFPSLMNKNSIEKAKSLSPLDILQIQCLYKCREAPAPSIRGSVRVRTDKQWNLQFKFLSEAAATKNFNISVAKQYLERTLETCGKTHFWPLKYPLIDNYDDHYTRVCVEKRNFGESCHFSIECESGECHEGKCAAIDYLKGFRLGNHYAGPISVANAAKCYAECQIDEACEAASFRNSSKSCYLFKGEDFTAYSDPGYVSMSLTDESLTDKIILVIQEGMRFVDYYKAFENMKSSLDCFLECTKDNTACAAASFSQADGNKCFLFKVGNHTVYKDSRYNTYQGQLPN